MEKNFTAIDFETFTPAYSSACAVGVVKVENGYITRKYYTLIKPIPDNQPTRNTFVHGITEEMVENAPTFAKIFPFLKVFIGDDVLVCHNASTDMRVLEACMDYYHLEGLDPNNYIDTFKIYGKGLDKCCAEFGVPLENHHDALCDAEACALCYLRGSGCVSAGIGGFSFSEVKKAAAHKKYESETLKPLCDEAVANKDTIFFHAKVVITGVFTNYPEREELGEILKNLGADIDTSITKKTNIVIAGVGAGPAKMKKIEDYNANGCSIRVIHEAELLSIFKDITASEK